MTRKRTTDSIPGMNAAVAGAAAAEWVRVDDLIEWDDNPREHDEKAVGEVAELIRAYGFGPPIVAREVGAPIVAGHRRLRAAKRLGLDVVPVRYMPWLTDAEAAELAVADNRAAEKGKTNDAKLAALLARFAEDRRGLIGYSQREASKLLARIGAGRDLRGDEDAIPERPAEPITQAGDVWLLGKHRLVCGDSTKTSTVLGATGGQRAELMFTDPPWGVSYGVGANVGREQRIRGDLNGTAFAVAVAVAVASVLESDARVYICGGWDNAPMCISLFDHHLQQVPRVIIWVKDSFVLRRRNYHAQYEVIYWGWKGAGGGVWYGDRKQSDVWSVPRHKATKHPNEKPVELAARAVGNSCEPGGLVYEPFGGSGSTLIACEKLGRRCVAIELDPGWCDAIVERWQNLTGSKATRGERISIASGHAELAFLEDLAPEPAWPSPPTSRSVASEERDTCPPVALPSTGITLSGGSAR